MAAKTYLQTNKWSKNDRQRFADRNIIRSTKIQGKKKPSPKAEEWFY